MSIYQPWESTTEQVMKHLHHTCHECNGTLVETLTGGVRCDDCKTTYYSPSETTPACDQAGVHFAPWSLYHRPAACEGCPEMHTTCPHLTTNRQEA